MKKVTTLFINLLICISAFCQTSVNSDAATDSLGEYQEKLSLVTSDQFFVPGERVHFSIKSTFPNGKPSFLSKVAYVELIDESKRRVLRTAVRLKSGSGHGYLYLPSYLRTAPYQLIAYTTWMLNFDRSYIPQVSLSIVNPYEPLPAEKRPNDSIALEFFPEGGTFKKGSPTKVVFAGKDHHTLSTFNARVLDADGRTVSTFAFSGNKESGAFQFSPDTIGIFKVLATDKNGDVYFSELEVSELSPLGIAVDEANDAYEVHLFNATGRPEKVRVTALSPSQYTETYTLTSDSTLTLTKTSLPSGLLQIQWENTEIDRLLFNAPNLIDVDISGTNGVFKPRELVRLSFQVPEAYNGTKVLLSVRKMYGNEPFQPIPEALLTGGLATPVKDVDFHLSHDDETLSHMLMTMQSVKYTKPTEITQLPDFRGQLLHGRLSGSMGKEHYIFLSSSYPDYHFYASKTNTEGEFFFNVNELSGESDLVLTSFAGHPKLFQPLLQDYSFVQMHTITGDSLMLEWLLRKSIDVQVENAYYLFKRDSVDKAPLSFLRKHVDKVYNFDEYTRFPTMNDMIVEIMDGLRTRKQGSKLTTYMPYVYHSSPIDSALILLNGVPVTTEYMLSINPSELEKAELISEQVKLGAAEFRGIVNLHLYDKNVIQDRLPSVGSYQKVDYMLPQKEVIYYTPDYQNEANTLSRVPDFRNQLLWNPSYVLRTNNSAEFYTSDLTGTFEVIVHGITEDGQVIYGRDEITVINE